MEATELQKASSFYYSDKYNLTKQQIVKDIEEYSKMKLDFKLKRITPSQVIGKGYKPQYVRQMAKKWIEDQLTLSLFLMANFDTKNCLTESQKTRLTTNF